MRLCKIHPIRKMQARDMCKSCYDKWLKKENPVYKKAQYSNTTKWARKYPERMKAIQEARKLRIKADPTFKQRVRNRALIRQYGIDQLGYERLLKNQKGGCKICNRKPTQKHLHVDHSHKTGKVRGLLCHQCNWYLGTIEADRRILSRIQKYLYGVKNG